MRDTKKAVVFFVGLLLTVLIVGGVYFFTGKLPPRLQEDLKIAREATQQQISWADAKPDREAIFEVINAYQKVENDVDYRTYDPWAVYPYLAAELQEKFTGEVAEQIKQKYAQDKTRTKYNNDLRIISLEINGNKAVAIIEASATDLNTGKVHCGRSKIELVKQMDTWRIKNEEFLN